MFIDAIRLANFSRMMGGKRPSHFLIRLANFSRMPNRFA